MILPWRNIVPILKEYGANYVSFARHKNVRCISHLHPMFEIVCVTKGRVKMTVDGKERNIQEGQATIILPLQSHSFEEGADSECMVCVFTENFAESFCDKVGDSVPEEPVCELGQSTLCYVNEVFSEDENIDRLVAQSILFPLCKEIYEKCSFFATVHHRDNAFIKAAEYTAEHFSEISGISEAAKAIGVNSAYLSRVFKQNSGHDYTYWLNCLKCSYAAQMLVHRYPELNISEIALAVGFGSIRSFNRVFREIFKMTPKEYIKQKKLFSL